MSKLFHIKRDQLVAGLLAGAGVATFPRFPDDYEEVVELDSENVTDVYRRTNNVDEACWTAEGVRLLGNRDDIRSTTTGDVVPLSDGRKFRYLGVGVEEI